MKRPSSRRVPDLPSNQGDVDKFNFLIPGVQKAGTTALHWFLSGHKQIFMPPSKELHFFNRESDIDWSNPNYSWYHQHLDKKDGVMAYGEATPIYMFWPFAIERIRNYNEQMRFIVIFRDPIERAYSHWKMEFARGAESLDFSTAIRQGRNRLLTNDALQSGAYSAFSYIERGLYAPQVRRLFENYPRHQTFFTTTDHLSGNARALLDDLCQFLKVETFSVYPDDEIVRPDVPSLDVGQMDSVDRNYLEEIFQPDIAETERLTGLDLSSWARRGQ